jgi:hypothetical protein
MTSAPQVHYLCIFMSARVAEPDSHKYTVALSDILFQ